MQPLEYIDYKNEERNDTKELLDIQVSEMITNQIKHEETTYILPVGCDC